MGTTAHDASDEALLLAARDEPDAFALFYRRHVRALAAYFWRRSRNAEAAADLTAETFAAALDGCGRFDPERGPAIGWLCASWSRRDALPGNGVGP
jgi:DNA-directed RNA polymerase specialized sigma24 family protein